MNSKLLDPFSGLNSPNRQPEERPRTRSGFSFSRMFKDFSFSNTISASVSITTGYNNISNIFKSIKDPKASIFDRVSTISGEVCILGNKGIVVGGSIIKLLRMIGLRSSAILNPNKPLGNIDYIENTFDVCAQPALNGAYDKALWAGEVAFNQIKHHGMNLLIGMVTNPVFASKILAGTYLSFLGTRNIYRAFGQVLYSSGNHYLIDGSKAKQMATGVTQLIAGLTFYYWSIPENYTMPFYQIFKSKEVVPEKLTQEACAKLMNEVINGKKSFDVVMPTIAKCWENYFQSNATITN